MRVLVDDFRGFRDKRPCWTARTSRDAVALLRDLHDKRIDELWLDHDLGGDDDIWPVVHLLDDAALAGEPYDIGVVHVHASRAGAAHRVVLSLRRAGYVAERFVGANIWRHGR